MVDYSDVYGGDCAGDGVWRVADCEDDGERDYAVAADWRLLCRDGGGDDDHRGDGVGDTDLHDACDHGGDPGRGHDAEHPGGALDLGAADRDCVGADDTVLGVYRGGDLSGDSFVCEVIFLNHEDTKAQVCARSRVCARMRSIKK